MESMDPLDEERRRLDRRIASVERVLLIFLVSAAAATVILGLFFMITIGGGRTHLPGRLTVAVAALVILGGIDGHATKLVNRRRPLLSPDPPEYRRFVVTSVVAFAGAAVVLLGVALLLP